MQLYKLGSLNHAKSGSIWSKNRPLQTAQVVVEIQNPPLRHFVGDSTQLLQDDFNMPKFFAMFQQIYFVI